MKPETEVSMALATSIMAYGAYQMALPSTADVRSLEPGNADIASAEKTAAWIAAGGVALVSILTKSPAVFTLGGLTIIGASWTTRHANAVSNISKRAGSMLPAPATGKDGGIVGDEVAVAQQLPVTPMYGVAV
ncbi:hypothetical protein [Streptomyces sp. NPDC087787]|uniref:hypothetical protein n=1 Tax=Streptomyces sp. NPDC087787 TaxID=3365803 RepID=UPI0037F4A77B